MTGRKKYKKGWQNPFLTELTDAQLQYAVSRNKQLLRYKSREALVNAIAAKRRVPPGKKSKPLPPKYGPAWTGQHSPEYVRDEKTGRFRRRKPEDDLPEPGIEPEEIKAIGLTERLLGNYAGITVKDYVVKAEEARKKAERIFRRMKKKGLIDTEDNALADEAHIALLSVLLNPYSMHANLIRAADTSLKFNKALPALKIDHAITTESFLTMVKEEEKLIEEQKVIEHQD